MKNYLTLLLFILFAGSLVAQCDITTGGIQATTTSEVRTNSDVQYDFYVANSGSEPTCSYPIGSVKVRVSLPGNATYGLKYINGPFTSTYFDWTYNSTTKVVTGINHTAIGIDDGETINLTFKAQEAPSYPRRYYVALDLSNNDADGAPLFPSNDIGNDYGYTTVMILPENKVFNVQCQGDAVAPRLGDFPNSFCSPATPTETVTTTVNACGNGTIEYLYTYTNCTTGSPNNRGFTWSYLYNIQDTQYPTFTAPANMTVNLNSSCELVVPDLVALVTNVSDNCDISPSVTQDIAIGTSLPSSHGSTHSVILTVTDCSGNNSTSTVVLTANDNTPPVITCPGNVTVNTGVGSTSCSQTATWTEPTATDNCTNVTLSTSHSQGATFPVGMTTVTYTATDDAGNTSTCFFTVTVIDNTLPMIANCPVDITVNTGAGNTSCSQTATWIAPTATDNCPMVTLAATHNPGDAFPVGMTTVTYTATDAAGNTSTCSFTVTVIDNTVPVIANCPVDITVNTGTGNTNCSQTATWTLPTATDNCTTVTLTTTHNPGDVFLVGSTTVTYIAEDAAGNTSTCSFTVTVIDDTPPVITCPGTVTVTTGDGSNGCFQIATWATPTVIDNCSSVTLDSTHISGALFPVGNTIVTYTATDEAGNISTCSFIVTVEDDTPPVIACPANITGVTPNAASCRASILLTAPTVSDNCGYSLTWAMTGATVATGSGVIPSPYLFNVGITTITYTATDVPNTVSCTYTVEVVNNLSATISGGGNTSVNAPTTVNVIFTGAEGTVPYTFAYTVNGGATEYVTTLGTNKSINVPHPNNTVGTFVYKIIGVVDGNGCMGTLPAPPDDQVIVIVSEGIDLSPSIPGPLNSTFFVGDPLREGYLQYTNGGLATTTGTVTFRVFKVSNFTLSIPTMMMTSGNFPFQVNVDNTTWTIIDNGLFFTVSKDNADIPAGGYVRIGYTLTPIGSGGSTGILTTTILNGTGEDNNDYNNKSTRTFIID